MKMTVALAPHLRRVGFGVTLVGVAMVALATLLPGPPAPMASHFCLICGSFGSVDAILNVFLFIPVGVGLALSGVSAKRALLAVCAFSTLIEIAQLLVIPGRDSTIGDVLTNTLGGALGFAIVRCALTWLRPSRRTAFALCLAGTAVWLAIQAISAYGFSPVMPASKYFGEIAPRLGEFDQFRGRVVRASIADIPFPERLFDDSRKVREVLLRGASVTVTFVPTGPTPGIAPVVRVADDRRREIVLLAQDGQKFIFGVRTGASVLRLRPPFFALPAVFSAASPADGKVMTDTLTVGARYSAHGVRFAAQTARASYERLIPIHASLGWTMVLPFHWYIEGTRTEHIVSVIWIAGFLLPIGYWGARLTRLSGVGDKSGWMTSVPIALALLYLGLVVVPKVFGLTPAPPADWLAGLTGILLGGMLQAPPLLAMPR